MPGTAATTRAEVISVAGHRVFARSGGEIVIVDIVVPHRTALGDVIEGNFGSPGFRILRNVSRGESVLADVEPWAPDDVLELLKM